MTDALNVQPACGDIGRNHNIQGAALKAINALLSKRLAQIAVQRTGGKPPGFKFFGQLYRRRFGAHEDNHAVKFFYFQNPRQGIQFMAGVNNQKLLHGGFYRAGFGDDTNFFGITQISCSDAPNGGGHGRGKQCSLASIGGLAQYGLDIINKAHAQHFISFIQDHRLQIAKLKAAAAQMVENAARGAHHNVAAAL